jgi:hypothetical protein
MTRRHTRAYQHASEAGATCKLQIVVCAIMCMHLEREASPLLQGRESIEWRRRSFVPELNRVLVEPISVSSGRGCGARTTTGTSLTSQRPCRVIEAVEMTNCADVAWKRYVEGPRSRQSCGDESGTRDKQLTFRPHARSSSPPCNGRVSAASIPWMRGASARKSGRTLTGAQSAQRLTYQMEPLPVYNFTIHTSYVAWSPTL